VDTLNAAGAYTQARADAANASDMAQIRPRPPRNHAKSLISFILRGITPVHGWVAGIGAATKSPEIVGNIVK
jgi:hypothetical protein